jgi:hypothetical protein
MRAKSSITSLSRSLVLEVSRRSLHVAHAGSPQKGKARNLGVIREASPHLPQMAASDKRTSGEELPRFSMDRSPMILILLYNSDLRRGFLSSLRSHALAVTLSGFADFAVAGERKKVKGSRRTTPNKPLAFSLYPLTYLGAPPLPLTSLRNKRIPHN